MKNDVSDTFVFGLVVGAVLIAALLLGIFSLEGVFKTSCDQHIIDAATEPIDERLHAELVLCNYEGQLLP